MPHLQVREDGAIDDQEPGDQAHQQQNLPYPSELQVLPSLMAEPEPPVPPKALDAGHLAPEAAEGNHQDGRKQQFHQEPLFPWLSTADDRRKINRRCDPTRRDPKNGELQVPGLGQAIGKNRGDNGEPETCRVDGIMGQQSPK